MPHAIAIDPVLRTVPSSKPALGRPSRSPPAKTMGLHDEGALEKFPDLDLHDRDSHANAVHELSSSAAWKPNGTANGLPSLQPAAATLPALGASGGGGGGVRWDSTDPQPNARAYGHHNRQKSLGDAIRAIRTRSGSTSQNVHDIADALKAPVSPTLIVLCVLWYSSSALTNTSSKSILNAFEKPATLTLVQFGFVSFYCILLAWLARVFPSLKHKLPVLKYGIRAPSAELIRTTLPLSFFQIGGHLLSSTATTKIPVSLVHTIKGLSPLVTVVAYRLFLNIRYPTATYLSLIPLTLGVMLACSSNHSFSGGQMLGIVYALLATVVFVSQNIVSKRLFNEASRAEAEGLSAKARKFDKLNLLCYSSGLAFLITGPIWFWSEGIGILGDFLYDGSVDLIEGPGSFDHGRLFVEFVFNGTFHFAQNILAFVLLSMVSPVTYSVASLIKRVFVIGIAILWFRSPTTGLQAVGILLTFLGLYLYDRTNENKADRRARTLTDAKGAETLLPLNAVTTTGNVGLGLRAPNGNLVFENGTAADASYPAGPHPYTTGYGLPAGDDLKKSDDNGRDRGRNSDTTSWMPPGTRQEDTWRLRESTAQVA
ncbi:er to golgi transport protein [Niveomyces insectorum RCEF 264]|uniref:Er to golgi transport protein n=1 Tax=Niveomyces insectorum RCEF 264 TaxID=1081102 RepID=A0A167ZBV3_9HYPO|nr:er to golgi transport protein [Niveomyces insectorum RCEF 264]